MLYDTPTFCRVMHDSCFQAVLNRQKCISCHKLQKPKMKISSDFHITSGLKPPQNDIVHYTTDTLSCSVAFFYDYSARVITYIIN